MAAKNHRKKNPPKKSSLKKKKPPQSVVGPPARARRAEHRLVAQLSRSLARQQLGGVDDNDKDNVTIVRTRPAAAPATNQHQRRRPAQRPVVIDWTRDSEQRGYEEEFQSLMERERAAVESSQRTRHRGNKPNNKKNKNNKQQQQQQRTLLVRKRNSNDNNSGKSETNANNHSSEAPQNTTKGGIQFQPARFSLEKSATQLVQETAQQLQQTSLFGNTTTTTMGGPINDDHSSSYIPLPPLPPTFIQNDRHVAPPQYLASGSFAFATARTGVNHNHNYYSNSKPATASSGSSNNNFFAALQEEDEPQQENNYQPPALPLFAFQPPSFTVTDQTSDDIDPDL